MDPGVEMLPVLLLRSFTPPPPPVMMGGGVGGGGPDPAPIVDDEFEFELAASTLEAAHMSNMVVELLEVVGLIFSGIISRFTRSFWLFWVLGAVPPPI